MNVLIMGPPGAGKGTQAARIVEQFGLRHLATGDLLRREIKQGSELGVKAKSFVDVGKLVPDEIIVQMMSSEILAASKDGGVLLDGFPRTLSQAKSLDRALDENNLELQAVLNIFVPQEVLLDRLLLRLTCEGCKRIFHKTSLPPAVEGRCDDCGGKLVSRSDDNDSVIEQRLKVYHAETEPVIKHYEEQKLLFQVDGNGSVDNIAVKIGEILGKLEKA